MKLSIKTKKLQQAIHRLAAAPALRNPTAVTMEADEFGGLVLQRNTPIATMRLECEAVVTEGGEVAIGFDLLSSLVGKIKAENIEIETDGPSVRFLVAGKPKWKLVTVLKAEVARSLPEVIGEGVKIHTADFAKMIPRAALAMFTEQGRENLRGVVIRTTLGRLCAMGTDGRRLHAMFGPKCKEPVWLNDKGFDEGVLLGKELISAVIQLIGDDHGEAEIKVCQNCAQVKAAGRLLRFAIPTETPPNSEKFMEEVKYENSFKVSRKELLEIAQVSAPLGAGAAKAISIRLVDSVARIEATDDLGNTFTDDLPATYDKEGHFRVNSGFFADLLKISEEEIVTIGHAKQYASITLREPNAFGMLALIRDHTTN